MAQQSFASVAVLVALAFAVMALQACASSEQREVYSPAMVAPPEFHDAPVGSDTLRSRISSDD